MATSKSYESVATKMVSDGVPWWLSCRLMLAVIAFFGILLSYTHRVGMSVAIVCMVNQTALRLERDSGVDLFNNTFLNGVGQQPLHSAYRNVSDVIIKPGEPMCELKSSNSTVNEDGPFAWPKEIQGYILGSFFYGYLLSQVPAGMLAERFGGKWVFMVFFMISTIGTLLTPIAAQLHIGFLICARVLVGIGSGGVFPIMHCIWGHWSPPMERSRLTGISYAGAMMGNVISLPLSGVLCQQGFGEGWDSVFYVFGGVSAIWLIGWAILVGDSPAKCIRISAAEKKYIEASLKGEISGDHSKASVPWRRVVTSLPMWAILVANFASDWGLYTFLTNIPTYMYEVLKFDMQSNGLYSALPFIGLWANMNISPMIADKLRESGTLSTGATRKLFNSIGKFGAATFLIALAFVDCTQTTLAVGLLSAGVAISGSSYTGFLVNHMDIAPRFAGTLFGLTNCLAAMSGFIAPSVAAALTKNQSREEWQVVFFIAAAMYVFGGIFYLIFASGELQWWAKGKEYEDIVEEVHLNGDVKKKKEAEEEA